MNNTAICRTKDINRITQISLFSLIKTNNDLNEFLKWLKGDYGLEQIHEPSDIINSAQEKYKEEFDKWFGQYFDAE